MAYKPTHAKPSAAARAAARGAAVVGAAAIAAGAGAAGIPAASADTTPLPVTLSADGNGTAVWSNGDIALTPGSTGTYAQMAVNLSALGDHVAPATAPSFTTDKFAGGTPRWVIELANGNYLFGYPQAEVPGGAADFSGAQWQEISGSGTYDNGGAYETYQTALKDAGDILGNVTVADAYIVADAGQSGVTSTLTSVKYDGESPVAPTPPSAAPVLSHGRHTLLNNNRVTIAWDSTPDNARNGYEVTIHAPGVENGRTAIVHTDEAVYSGLEAGHTGWVSIQPLQASGQPYSGDAGHVYFTTTSAK